MQQMLPASFACSLLCLDRLYFLLNFSVARYDWHSCEQDSVLRTTITSSIFAVFERELPVTTIYTEKVFFLYYRWISDIWLNQWHLCGLMGQNDTYAELSQLFQVWRVISGNYFPCLKCKTLCDPQSWFDRIHCKFQERIMSFVVLTTDPWRVISSLIIGLI